MSKLTTYVAALAIGVAAWNGYDAYTKREEVSTTKQQLSVTTGNLLTTQQHLRTTTEKLSKAQQKLEIIAAEEHKTETDLTVALSRGKNILNATLPTGYQEGTIITHGGDIPLQVQVSFQGPVAVQVKECSVGMILLPDKKVTVQSLYATALTTQAMQNEPSVVVLAGTVKIPQDTRNAFYEHLKNNPMMVPSGNDLSYTVLAKGDSYVLVAAEAKNNTAVEQTASALQKKYGLEVITAGKGAEKKNEVQKSESVKEQKPQTLDSLLHVTNETFEKDVLKAEKPVLVDFYADWCGPCQAMAPIYEEVSKEYTSRVKFAKLDIKTFSHPKVQEYGINAIPMLLLFDKGKEIGRAVGYHDKIELRKFIDGVVKK